MNQLTHLAALLLGPCAAGIALAQTGGPPNAVVVDMAQHLVQEHVMFETAQHYHIEFDVAYVHPQPEGDYWAVVGGFVSDQSTPNTYVAAVRLLCPEFHEVACWLLEKLAINETVVIDRSREL